jgi:hypothetical protein
MPEDLGTDFPTKIYVSLDETRVPMTEVQHDVYLRVERRAAASEATGEGAPMLSNAFLNKTRQFCNTVHKVPTG